MPEDQVSRRRMLKRMGAGAAVVWTAPAITSLMAGPAFAASGGPCDCRSDPCLNPCSPGCDCAQDVSDTCGCFIPSCLGPCSQNADCGPGFRCVVNCCGPPTCAQLCSGGSRHTGKKGWS